MVQRILTWPALRAFRHADFRLLWIGSFLSFTGTQVQNVAQGAYVYELTGNKTALALVTFCGMFPITVLGPLAGIVADLYDRRKILIGTSVAMCLATGWNAVASQTNSLAYWQIIVVALIGGFVATVEQPCRQTIVRQVVGDEDLPSAVPAQAMTFNVARIVGPAIGGILAATVGYAVCFWLNAVSYLGIGAAAATLKTDLRPTQRRDQDLRDLIFEGMLFTFREPRLRLLFLMEGSLSLFGIGYLSQMPAIATDLLHLDKRGLGYCYSAVGVGAFLGLIGLAAIAHLPYKTAIIRTAMVVFSAALILLSRTEVIWLALPLMGLMGGMAIMQFNTTNTLFQLLSPSNLRGRVLAMHMWAIGGLAPLGSLWMGKAGDLIGLHETLLIGGLLVLLCAALAWIVRHHLPEPTDTFTTDPAAA